MTLLMSYGFVWNGAKAENADKWETEEMCTLLEAEHRESKINGL